MGAFATQKPTKMLLGFCYAKANQKGFCYAKANQKVTAVYKSVVAYPTWANTGRGGRGSNHDLGAAQVPPLV